MDSFSTFIEKHIFFAILLFVMSLSAITLVVWRLMLNFNATTDMNAFLPRFQQVLANEGPDGGLNFCRAQPESQLIPRKLFVSGLETNKQGLAAMRRSMATTIELDIVPALNFLLPPILAIAKIATMVGLLGTVISMIGTFQELGKGGEEGANAKATSEQIGLALWATALGLLTAIPLVFSHVLFKAWVHKYEVTMQSSAQKLLVLMQAFKSGQLAAIAGGTGPTGPPGAAPAAAAGTERYREPTPSTRRG